MANFEGVTSSNWAKVKDVQAMEKVLGRFVFSCEVSPVLECGMLGFFGYDWLYVEIPDEENDGFDFTEQMLEELSPLLDTVLILQMIGHEKCRFPLSFVEARVLPNGMGVKSCEG